MPVVFAAHGAPILLDDSLWMSELRNWAEAMPKPESVLVISAHWVTRPLALGATTQVPLVYDFYGFPERYYETRYATPGAGALAARVRELLGAAHIAHTEADTRGLDHGAYVPLVAMYPEANIPVLQLSMPSLDNRELFAIGSALAPLRSEGVLILASGFLTHNMAYAFRPGIPAWAREFDAWVADAIQRFDIDALINFEQRAPSPRLALPTVEHYSPLLIAVGAASVGAASVGAHAVSFPIEGFWMDGAFTKRSVQFG